MPEKNHFQSYFSPFNEYATTSILFLFTTWPPAIILDDQKSLYIIFLFILDQYATYFKLVCKMVACGHVGCPKIIFNRVSRHFRSIG